MSLSAIAAFCFQNAATTAVVTASSSLTLCPPANLLTDQLGQVWCTQTDTAYLTIALATATTIDTIGLFGLNLGTAAVTRVRASLTDTSAVDGAKFDSGSASGRISTYYGNLVALMDGSQSCRYIRIDLTQTGVTQIQAGFLMIGLRNQVTTNFTPGAADTPVDSSVVTQSRSGADWIDQRAQWREWDMSFDHLTETEAFGWVEDLDHLCGIIKNVMVIRNCASSNLGRDTLLGRMTSQAPTVSRADFAGDGLPARSKSYKIKQRL